MHNFLLNIANTGKKKEMDAIANMQLVSVGTFTFLECLVHCCSHGPLSVNIFVRLQKCKVSSCISL